MEINPQMPAFHYRETIIQAPPEAVFHLVASLDNWPLWQSGVRMLEGPSRLEAGSAFKWTNGGMPISSVVTEIEEAERIEWTSRAMWIHASIYWEFEAVSGGTRIRYAQSLEGFGASLMRKALIKSMEITLLELKRFCETALVHA